MWYIMLAVGIYLCVYTSSYGVWEWNKGNKTGAVAVWLLCLTVVAAPVVGIFF